MQINTYRSETLIEAPLGEVFDFFSRAENLERLTPASVRFEILSPLPIEMKVGALIEYRIRLLGIPMNWLTKITLWEHGIRFKDVQVRGPYRLWEHEHRFEAVENGTLMIDTVRYAVPGWFLSPLINRWFVRGQLDRIWKYRAEGIQKVFPGRAE